MIEQTTINRDGKLTKITLQLDSKIAEYLKVYSKKNRLSMSYIVENLIARSIGRTE